MPQAGKIEALVNLLVWRVQPEVKDRELAIVPPILLQIPGLKALLLKSTDDMVQKLLDKYADVSAANPLSKVRRRCHHAAATISHAPSASAMAWAALAGCVVPRLVTMRLGGCCNVSQAAPFLSPHLQVCVITLINLPLQKGEALVRRTCEAATHVLSSALRQSAWLRHVIWAYGVVGMHASRSGRALSALVDPWWARRSPRA